MLVSKLLLNLYVNWVAPICSYFFIDIAKENGITEGNCYHTYDLLNDIIKLTYMIRGKEYILCLPRKTKDCVMKLYCELITKKMEKQTITNHVILDARLNDDIEITDRFNKYLGDHGSHLKYSKFRIRWLLTINEMKKFKKLILFTNNCEEIECSDINDYVIISN